MPKIGPYIEAVTLPPNGRPRDPLGRKPGESIDLTKYPPEKAQALKTRVKTANKRQWFALYQQTPIVEGGNLLSRQHFLDKDRKRVLKPDEFDKVTSGVLWVRFWDLAYTAKAYDKPNPDWTVGSLMAFRFDAEMTRYDIFLRHQARMRGNWSDVKREIHKWAQTDNAAGIGTVYVGAEANGPQKAAVDDLRASPYMLPYVVWDVPTGLSKTDRAELWMDRAREGYMWLCEGSWNSTFFDEIEGFPNAPHDDAVDSVSGAYAMCMMRANEHISQLTVGSLDIVPRWGR